MFYYKIAIIFIYIKFIIISKFTVIFLLIFNFLMIGFIFEFDSFFLSKIIFISLLPKIASKELVKLKFKKRQTIVSFVSTLNLKTLKKMNKR